LRHLLVTLSVVSSLFTVIHGQRAPICRDWQDCRQLALEASARGEYERFHDLAWGAVQAGPKNDSGLMYLLARAQVLSGRPHDALIMLQRLAVMGVATEAATDPDFERTRALPGWPEVAAAIARAATGAAAEAPRTVAVAPRAAAAARPAAAPRAGATVPRGAAAASAAATAAPKVVPLPIEAAASSDAGRFSTGQLRTAGLAYDAVSRRFVIGDALGRKLLVVGFGADHADDLVRGDSAGFDDLASIAIDELRGNLWVLSTSNTSGGSALHRLQLVSGRSLRLYPAPPRTGRTQLVDLAVQVSGDIIALDSAGNRLLSLASGGSELSVVMPLKLSGAKSIAAQSDDVLFVAHDEGIARVDMRSRTVTTLSAPKGFDLQRFETIRAHRDSLIGLQTTSAGARQLVRLRLNPAGRAIREGTVIDPRVAETEGNISLTIRGDELYYLASEPVDTPTPSPNRSSPAVQIVVRRLVLR
jgi:hypothetical protein